MDFAVRSETPKKGVEKGLKKNLSFDPLTRTLFFGHSGTFFSLEHLLAKRSRLADLGGVEPLRISIRLKPSCGTKRMSNFSEKLELPKKDQHFAHVY